MSGYKFYIQLKNVTQITVPVRNNYLSLFNMINENQVFREKRKWQMSLRRYIIEKGLSYQHATFFGIDHNGFREWIEIQFTENMSWSNYAAKWQFDHIVPVAYFDFNNEVDLKLCWNFINIRPEPFDFNKVRGNRLDVLGSKSYFEQLYLKTNNHFCKKMIEKIDNIVLSQFIVTQPQEVFLIEHNNFLNKVKDLDADEYKMLNSGMTIDDIIIQREIFRKYAK
jgi:hypothetical protein